MIKELQIVLDLVISLRETQEQFLLLYPDNKRVQGKLEAYSNIEDFINKKYGDKNGKN